MVLVTLYVYFLLPQINEALFWPTKEVLNELAEYSRLAIPSMIMFLAIYLCLQIYVFVAGNLSAAN